MLSWLLPEAISELRGIANRISRWLEDEAEGKTVCHGDFYDKQIIVRRDGLVLLDFDQACIGDHRSDVANFVAHVVRLAIPESTSVINTFLDAYEAKSSSALNGLHIYVAFCLLKLAHHPFRSGDCRWPAQTRRMIALARRWLENEEGCP